MEKKRKLSSIIATAGVGITTIVGGIEVIKGFIEISDKLATPIERHIGLIGSGAVKYGLPVIVGVGVLSLIYTATKATDRYLLE